MKRSARRSLNGALGSAALALLLASGAAHGADLLQLYRDALAYDAQYASARSQLEAGREQIPQGLAGLLPNIGLSANASRNFVDVKQPLSAHLNFNTTGYALQLTQPLFRWQNWIQYDQAKLQVAQSEIQFASARQDLILRVAQAYFDVLLAQDTLGVNQAQKKAIGEQLEQAKRNFEVGTSTIVDTHDAQARYDLATSQEIAAQNDLEVKRQALRLIVGKEPEALRPLKESVEIQPPQPADMQKWVETAEQSYPVQLQQATLDIAARDVERNRAGHYPTLDLVATSSYNNQGASTVAFAATPIETYTNSIGLQLAIPIYQGGAVNSRVRQAAALRDKAAQDLENARRTAAQAARQAYLGVTSGIAQVKALEQAVVSSQSSLDSNKLGYDVGVRINIDVLNAQQQLYSTRRDLASARYTTLLSQLRLKSAAGTLDEDDVRAVNALLAQ